MFWIILSIILFLALPFFKNGFYDEEKTQEWVKLFEKWKIDSTQRIKKDTLPAKKDMQEITWRWHDYVGNNYFIKFSASKSEINKARTFRKAYQNNDVRQLYYDFINVSNTVIDSMYYAMRNDIKDRKLLGIEILNYVVTAIQTPKYTLIVPDNQCPFFDKRMQFTWKNECEPRDDGCGCCNNVIPFGVYTPAEFISQKTGDCDTKSLIAYAILKKFKFDAALILGETDGGYHAMLAIANVNPVIRNKYIRHHGFLYYPWEVTSFNNRCQLGSTEMWRNWRNWEVFCD